MPIPAKRPRGQISHPSVLTVFHPHRDQLAEKPYTEQADMAMYTPDSLAMRAALREHPAVQVL